MSKTIRFIVITVPPKMVASEIEALRRPLCEFSRSFAALAYPPHVTLRTGMVVPEDAVDTFLEEFGATITGVKPFEIRTDGYLFTPYRSEGTGKYLLGLKVIKSRKLGDLHQRLMGYTPFMKTKNKPFDPHLTLVFDDLAELQYFRLQKHVETKALLVNKRFSWQCDHVGLYVLKDSFWVCARKYNFEKIYQGVNG